MRELLKLAEIPRSTFYYNLKNMKKEDKYKVEKDEILSIFNENFIIFWDIIDKNINKKMYISGG